MKYVPAPLGFTVVRTHEAGTEDAIERFAVRADPLVMYAYVDSDDRPISVYPVLGCEDWEVDLLDAISGEYRWHALPDDLAQQAMQDIVDKHHEQTCATEPTCHTTLKDSYRQGLITVQHSEDCVRRQEERQRAVIALRVASNTASTEQD